MRRARTATGRTMQVTGVVLWMLSGFSLFIWSLFVLFATFGPFALVVALVLAPLTVFASFLIVWFSTGLFPVGVFLLWLFMWAAIALIGVGGAISGDE